MYDLQRFKDAQEKDYSKALSEIKDGRKRSHWIWYIFPQLAALGKSELAKYYGIENKEEAIAYLTDPILRNRLIEISEALLLLSDKSALQIMGSPDDLKLCSCMTLFADLKNTDPVFNKILTKYFQAKKDPKTLMLL